jgi:GDSL-like Lipase/Acylhydrolase family
MTHIALLGDSTLDNAAYVPPAQAVLDHLERTLPPGWRASLLALDGSVIADIELQLQRLPTDTSHLIVSVGGNDALGASGVLQEPATSVAQALGKLSRIREAFQAAYASMLDTVLARRLPTAICTIYDAAFPEPDLRKLAATALATLNDCITRLATTRGVPLIDLRIMFNRDADYANAIEPSSRGGEKFAAAIRSVVAEHDFARRRAEIFAASG